MTGQEHYDILVIGGGIHGVGVAQAAAAAGYRTVVLEKSDLAAGTSSKSSKLIHGGLRYLESFQFGLVRESLHERELLIRLAPSLVQRRRFFIPVYRETHRRPWQLRTGLAMYAVLSGLRRNTAFRVVPRPRWTDLDGLSTQDLQRIFQYWDAQTDDRLLTCAVWRSAERLGARLVCPGEFLGATVDSTGCEARFRIHQQEHTVGCDVIVNAAGPWAGEVCRRIDPPAPAPRVDLVQGTHLELPGRIAQGCYYLEAPQDGRAVFVMPWKDRTLLGTTELVWTASPDQTAPTPQEVRYLLEVYRHYFPGRSTEVLDQWSGLRVLPSAEGAPTRRSRETQLVVDDPRRIRILSVFGGKLTGYRATAEKVMGRLRSTLPSRTALAATDKLPLNGD